MLPPPAGFMPSSWDLPPGKAVSGMSLMLAGCDMTSSALILPPADGASRTNWHARCPPGPCPWLPPPADWMPELCPPWISQAPQRQSRNGGGAAIDYSVPRGSLGGHSYSWLPQYYCIPYQTGIAFTIKQYPDRLWSRMAFLTQTYYSLNWHSNLLIFRIDRCRHTLYINSV